MTRFSSARVRPGILLGALVALYILAVAVLAAQGSYVFVRKSAILPAFCVAALLSRRLAPFVRDWSVFLGLTFLFDAIRGAIYAAITRFDLPVYMGYAIDAERRLLGGAVMPVLLQDRWPTAPAWFEGLLVVVHASHFVFFLTLGLAVWLLRRDEFRRYCAAMLLVMYGGLLVYLLLPTVPPWMAADYQVIPPVERIGMQLYNTSVPTLSAGLATNPVAAMPSLHAAFPAVGTLVALRVFGRRAAWTVAYTLLSAVSVLYLGEHYLVDVLAGWLLGAGACALVFRARPEGRRSPVPAAPAAPVAVREVAAALAAGALLVAAAEGVGFAKARIQTDFVPTRAFIDRELIGRSPAAEEHVRLRARKDAAAPVR